MSIIALFNIAAEYLKARRTNQALRHLDDHYLKDIGFRRQNGVIRPLAGNDAAGHEETEMKVQIPPGKQPSDG